MLLLSNPRYNENVNFTVLPITIGRLSELVDYHKGAPTGYDYLLNCFSKTEDVLIIGQLWEHSQAVSPRR